MSPVELGTTRVVDRRFFRRELLRPAAVDKSRVERERCRDSFRHSPPSHRPHTTTTLGRLRLPAFIHHHSHHLISSSNIMSDRVKDVVIDEVERVKVLSQAAARSGAYLYPLKV